MHRLSTRAPPDLPEGIVTAFARRYRTVMDADLQKQITGVSAALRKKLHVNAPTLRAQMRKAGRRLPYAVRRDIQALLQAADLARNPKLARQIDPTALRRAHRRILTHLDGLDLAAQRRTAFLNILASIAFALLVTGALILVVLVQRGFV